MLVQMGIYGKSPGRFPPFIHRQKPSFPQSAPPREAGFLPKHPEGTKNAFGGIRFHNYLPDLDLRPFLRDVPEEVQVAPTAFRGVGLDEE